MGFHDIISMLFLGLLLIPIGLFVITLLNLTIEDVRRHKAMEVEGAPMEIQHGHEASARALRLVK
ncbi:hypothetical protein [Alkaliphilus serpentinus]|uniref:Uncharacterized protein n=1 Tax=Alkaliphilus serpentinus TaxID=1482731 RepID=A0A833HQD9_9FIRM|nr:hypothetical protein [Alkaliphilus serpentinus]KAB3531803.1 hypothetical protein F8153_03540 [Alkaliphilus serpentinus]